MSIESLLNQTMTDGLCEKSSRCIG